MFGALLETLIDVKNERYFDIPFYKFIRPLLHWNKKKETDIAKEKLIFNEFRRFRDSN